MNLITLISLIGAMILLAGCGATERAGDAPSKSRLVEVRGPHGRLAVRLPVGSPPKSLLVKELRRGSGSATARAGDEVVANYVGLNYGSGEPFYDTWEHGGPTRFHLHHLRTGWERGLNGMRVGGRRELIVPSRLAYESGPIVYVVELLEAKPWGS